MSNRVLPGLIAGQKDGLRDGLAAARDAQIQIRHNRAIDV